MDSGMASYALANHILAHKRSTAQHQRLLAELRSTRREQRRLDRIRAEQNARWSLEWSSNGLTGKPVSLVNGLTGERSTGRDPADWDRAMGRAMQSVGAERRNPAATL